MTNRQIFVGSVVVAAVGWGLLLYFTYAVGPDPLSIGVVLLLFFVALVGTSTPIMCYANFRFGGGAPDQTRWGRPLRQAALVSLYIIICCLLRILGVLGWTTALLLLGVIFATEIALITCLR